MKIVNERIECFGSSSAGIKIAEICMSGLGGSEKYDFRGTKNTIYDVMKYAKKRFFYKSLSKFFSRYFKTTDI